jgi:hypothetical protein
MMPKLTDDLSMQQLVSQEDPIGVERFNLITKTE